MTHWLPTPDQREIADAISSAIADALPLDRLHGAQPSDRHRLPDLGALGVLGISVSEDAGGSGLGVVEEALVFEQLGYQLASPAVLANVLAGHASADAGPLVTGEAIAAIGTRKSNGELLVFDADKPETTIILDGPAVVVSTGDPCLSHVADNPWRVDLHRSKANCTSLADGEELALRARLLIASHLSGIARRALDMAVEYAKIREQFGKPIGSFQAVKHHAANMAVAALAARDLVAFAAIALEQGRADASFQIQSAVLTASKAARDNAGTNIQIHGGIGFSDECDAHLVLKHAQVWDALLGGAESTRAALLEQSAPLTPAAA